MLPGACGAGRGPPLSRVPPAEKSHSHHQKQHQAREVQPQPRAELRGHTGHHLGHADQGGGGGELPDARNGPSRLPVLFAGKASLELPSGTYTLAELTPPFQKAIAAVEATTTAETAYHDTVAAEHLAVAAALALRKEVKQVAAGQFGPESSTLSQLGFAPAKPRKVSAATKAASAAKAVATRKAKKAAKASVTKPAT
jgi:hypothetical protein